MTDRLVIGKYKYNTYISKHFQNVIFNGVSWHTFKKSSKHNM